MPILITQTKEAESESGRIIAYRGTDLTGQVFGRLTVIRRGWVSSQTIWHCSCLCGSKSSHTTGQLRAGRAKSCGCLRRELSGKKATTHGEDRPGLTSPELRAFRGAKNRCRNVNSPKYASYGGRGIEFRFESFEQFLAELGRRPSPTHTLNRKENDGHYEPGNVEWATPTEQSNNRRSNRYLEIRGEIHTVAEWSRIAGVRYSAISSRLGAGWCAECSITPLASYVRGFCQHR